MNNRLNTVLWIGMGFLVFTAPNVFAKPFKTIKTTVGPDTCLKVALAIQDGAVVKMELKKEHGISIYEIEIAGKDNNMEFECDVNTGKITEQEQEVRSPNDPQFKSKARIGVQDAAHIALTAHPGRVLETEFEIEANGEASYEFDIQTNSGKKVKLEVDAASGKIVEDDEEEIYQIGLE